MSYVLVDRVFKTDSLTKTERLVLMSLAQHAHNDATESYPSIATMMQQASASHGGVCRALRSLKKKQYIRESQPGVAKGGRRKTVHYALLIENWRAFPTEENHPLAGRFDEETIHSTDENHPVVGPFNEETVHFRNGNRPLSSENHPLSSGNHPLSGHESVINRSKNRSSKSLRGASDFSGSSKEEEKQSKSACREKVKRNHPESGSRSATAIRELRGIFRTETSADLTARANKRLRDLLAKKVAAAGIEAARQVVKRFAESPNDWSRVRCPLALLVPDRWEELLDDCKQDAAGARREADALEAQRAYVLRTRKEARAKFERDRDAKAAEKEERRKAFDEALRSGKNIFGTT